MSIPVSQGNAVTFIPVHAEFTTQHEAGAIRGREVDVFPFQARLAGPAKHRRARRVRQEFRDRVQHNVEVIWGRQQRFRVFRNQLLTGEAACCVNVAGLF